LGPSFFFSCEKERLGAVRAWLERRFILATNETSSGDDAGPSQNGVVAYN
jgi:hypothetical protein